MKKTTILLMLTLAFLLSLSQSFAQAQIVRRAMFDIGSGSTKMVVADVDLHTGKIKIIYEQEQPVPYKMDLEQSTNHRFSEKVCNRGTLVLAKMKWQALQQGAKQFAARRDFGLSYRCQRQRIHGIHHHRTRHPYLDHQPKTRGGPGFSRRGYR